jgi:hypothetical protein
VIVRSALTAALLALVLAAAAGASSRPAYLSNCGRLAQHPKAVVLACADANYELASLAWSSWGSPAARAIGIARANDCTPNCAAGSFHAWPVSVRADRPTSCGGKRIYLRLTVSYGGKLQTGHPRHEVWSFTCAQATHR